MNSHHNIGLGILCGMGAGALWGIVFLVPEVARSFSGLELTIGRYLAYGLIAALLIGPRWKSLFSLLGKREWGALMLLALTGNTLYYIMVTQAVQLGGIAMTSLIMGLVPVAVTVVGSRQKDAVPLSRLIPSILLCVASAVAIGWDSVTALANAQDSGPFIGLLLAIGGLIAWTVYALINSHWLGHLRGMGAHDWSLLIGLASGLQAVLLLPVALLFFPSQHSQSDWFGFVMLSLGIALLASIGGNALWNRANRLLPLTLVGQMVLFETMFALLYAFIWEQRGPTMLESIAFACVVASIISCMAAHRKPSPPAPPILPAATV